MKVRDYLNYWYFIVLIIIIPALAFQIWNVTNFPETRDTGYLYIEGLVILALLIISYMGVYFDGSKKGFKKFKSTSVTMTYAFLIFNIVIGISFIPLLQFDTQLLYYFHMALFVAVTLVVMIIANTLQIEKSRKEGFNISLVSQSSELPERIGFIPTILIIKVAVFTLMLVIVGTTGISFVPAPSFSLIGGDLLNPIITAFMVGATENMALIFIPMEITKFIIFTLILRRKKFNGDNLPLKLLMIGVGIGVFAGHHLFRYGLNTPALVSTMIFAGIAGLLYIFTGTPVIANAMHEGNNFASVLYSASVIGLSTIQTSPTGTLLNTLIVLIPVTLLIMYIYWRYR